MRGLGIFFGSFALVVAGCSSHNSLVADAGSGGDCTNAPTVAHADYAACSSCTAGGSCTAAAPLEACCTWLAQSNFDVARGVNLHRFSSSSSAVDDSCLSNPGTPGTPQNVKVSGYVWLFSGGLDSTGVKVQVYKEGPNGALGDLVGSATTGNGPNDTPYDPTQTTWSSKCQPDGCKFRPYSISGVPTETKLVFETSDSTGQGTWATLYDYNIYFSNSKVQSGAIAYDASAVYSTDINVVSGTVNKQVEHGKGLLAGEVHDCGDVRLAHATVEIDQPHDGPIYYFTEDESNPLPSLAATDTSHLGLFGAFNVPIGTPIRVTAVGRNNGQYELLGTYVVQAFDGAVTALSFRGRRPWQQ